MKKLLVIDHPRKTSIEHYNDVANCPLAASLNSGYAVAVGKHAGWNTEYLDFLTQPESPSEMAQKVIASAPDIVALHWVYSWGDESHVFDFLSKLRKNGFKGTICAFGLFPTFCGDDIIKRASELDCILLGEFEETLEEVLLQHGETNTDKYDTLFKNIAGLLLKSGPTSLREVAKDLDYLPSSIDVGKTSQLSYINIAASRGCYGQCSFCFINPYYGCRQWRGRSVKNVIKELKAKIDGRNSKFVYFVDPNFFGPGKAGQQRALELAKELKKLNISFGLEARVNDIHEETICALADAGLESVFLGIESGCNSVLERMNKHITVKQSERAIQILNKAEVKVSVGFIMFEPDSTLEEIEQNLSFLERNNLLDHHDLTSNMLYHNQIVLKGTPSYKSLEKFNRLVYDPETPYEAKFTYEFPEVGRINLAMGELTNEYYRQMDSLWRDRGYSEIEQFEQCHASSPTEIPHAQINTLLIESFKYYIKLTRENPEANLDKVSSDAVSNMKQLFSK